MLTVPLVRKNRSIVNPVADVENDVDDYEPDYLDELLEQVMQHTMTLTTQAPESQVQMSTKKKLANH